MGKNKKKGKNRKKGIGRKIFCDEEKKMEEICRIAE